MSTEDFSILPYDDLTPFERLREQPRKLEADKKVHKYRPIYKGDGLLNKSIVYENYPRIDYDPTTCQYDWNKYNKQRDALDRTRDEIDVAMGNGLNLGVLYSQGKKKRWELVNELKKEVPEIEDQTTSSSVVELSKNRTAHESELKNNDPLLCDFSPRSAQLRNVNGCIMRDHKKKIVKYAYRTKDGQEGSGKGKFDPRIATLPQTESKDTQIHIEYQILNYEMNEKLHNSFKRKVPVERKMNSHPEVEGCRLRYDVVGGAMGRWKTGDRERVGKEWRGHSDLPEEIVEESEETNLKRGALTLGDFLPKELPKKTGRRKKSLSASWDFV